MTKLAVFSDIHANLPALEAVFADLEARGFESIDCYCLGDLVGYGVFPNEVIDLLRARQIQTIRGNYDEAIGQQSDDCGCGYTDPYKQVCGRRSVDWTNTHITDENRAYLNNLPFSLRCAFGGKRIGFVHGTPRSITEYLYPSLPEETVAEFLDAMQVDVLCCGHTHEEYKRILSDGRMVINSGSLGKPKDDPRALYVLLHHEEEKITVEFVRVTYDYERAAAAIEQTTMPHDYAQTIRTGKGI